LSNVIKQYRVTYNSDDQMFVVHRESKNKPNMEFRMHESGLHYYDPRTESATTINYNGEFTFACQHCLREQGRFHAEADQGCRAR
jgi:hypothetical protein